METDNERLNAISVSRLIVTDDIKIRILNKEKEMRRQGQGLTLWQINEILSVVK